MNRKDINDLMQEAIAHSANEDGQAQLLIDHLRSVAKLAFEFGSSCHIGDMARLAGLWHDLGKLTTDFQRKLYSDRKSYVDHKGLGALIAFERKWIEVAFAIAGHHGGLPNLIDLPKKCQPSMQELYSAINRFRELSLDNHRAPTDFDSLKDGLATDLRTRMLFSCLVDADWLDTEAHFSGKEARNLGTFPELEELTKVFFHNHEELIAKAQSNADKDEVLFKLRCGLFEKALRKAEDQPGVFSLTIPTGGGKTRIALGFGLQHALKHAQKRIIVALPYTSILDQMAEEYRGIFGDDNFLLHYTGWQGAAESGLGEETTRDRKMRLAAENWDAPLILTTTVQLFDSLFANKPFYCRKLHNLAGSVIVLDEVQTLPLMYLEPICDVLGELVKSYGVTVVLSTATQPALDRVKSFIARVGKPKEIISDPATAYRMLERVSYNVHIDDPWSWDKVCDELLNSSSGGMVIVNAKKHAVELFNLVRAIQSRNVFHLSTFMCGAHRRRVIQAIKETLARQEPCWVVSTQLVEAGVDLDFPFVMRAVAPLDRVVQAAGRCNREGKLGKRGGRVVVFKPEENTMPRGSYETCAKHFETMYRAGKFDPNDPAVFPLYFKRVFQDVDLDAKHINPDRKIWNFATVADKFELIEQGATQSVLTGYGSVGHKWDGSPAAELLEQLVHANGLAKRRLYRRLQPYVVAVYQKKIGQLKGNIILEDAASNELYWWGAYDDCVGIAKEQQELDNLFA